MILKFGKYKGLHISKVPDSYLKWMIKELKKDIQSYTDELYGRLSNGVEVKDEKGR